jgi:hypothetical protein
VHADRLSGFDVGFAAVDDPVGREAERVGAPQVCLRFGFGRADPAGQAEDLEEGQASGVVALEVGGHTTAGQCRFQARPSWMARGRTPA